MAHILTLHTPSREDWLTQRDDVVTEPDELLRLLNIDADEKLLAGRSAKMLFALRVPRSFLDRMENGTPNDPLLRQVITSQDEFVVAPGFSTEPLEEQHSVVPGLLPKYHNRALLLDKVDGAAHFMVCDDEARLIMRELLSLVSGFLVPKLAREFGGVHSKTPLDLQLRQQ